MDHEFLMPMDSESLMLTKLDLILNHMVLKDAHDAGLLPDDLWTQYLSTQINVMKEVMEKNGNETEGSMV